MAGSEFTFDTRELAALSMALHKLSVLAGARLFHEIGVTEEGEIKERFESKEDPDGRSWKDWSARTKRKAGASILVQEGRLKESVGFEVTPEGVLFGSTLVYARIHQKGGKAGRGNKVSIPARPYLGIGESSRELIGETIGEFLRRESGGLIR